jgi:pteridine reductase
VNLDGKHALVTGAARRVGRQISEALLQAGAHLSLHYWQSETEALALKSLAATLGRSCTLIRADLKEPTQIHQAVSEAVERLGPVSILVNSASEFVATPALTCTPEEWDAILGTNLRGQFFFAQEAGRTMLREKQGVILNIADVNAEKALRNHVAYIVSKGGLLSMTRNLAYEWAPHVRVNSISPGPVLAPERYSEETKQKSANRTLLHRWGAPADVAQAALFLIENDYITGFDLKVDGGRDLIL